MDSVLTKYDFIGVGREDGIKKGEFCAIYYESDAYNVIESSTFWLSDTPENVSIGWDAALERICTYGLFEHTINKKQIWVFNTHFDHMGEIARIKSSELICISELRFVLSFCANLEKIASSSIGTFLI
jgi:hypothetical protein